MTTQHPGILPTAPVAVARRTCKVLAAMDCSIASTPIAGLFILAGFLHAASPEISIALMGVGIGLAVLLGLVFSALNGIAKAVLYNFALDGDLPREIHNSTLDGLVVQRRDDENSAPGRIQT